MGGGGRPGNLPNILDMHPDHVAQLVSAMDQPAYRARQLLRWVYKKRATSFSVMTDLPLSWRFELQKRVVLQIPEVKGVQNSVDGTRKYLLIMQDGEPVESVAVFSNRRRFTACISSQVGCPVGCSFCASGHHGLVRNLTVSEIIGQLLVLAGNIESRLTNVVFMGTGEPLLNYDHVIAAARSICHPEGLAIGARRVTISTCGVVPGIRRLAEEPLQLQLAVSLHAADDCLRNRLVPINRKYPITELLSVCRHYSERTGRRVTYEYVLLGGINDNAAEAHRLGRLLAGSLCHVNLIPYNPTQDAALQQPREEDTKTFARIVLRYGVETTVRREKGSDIQAACGQLRRRYVESRRSLPDAGPKGEDASR